MRCCRWMPPMPGWLRNIKEKYASIGGPDAARSEPAWYFSKVPESKDPEGNEFCIAAKSFTGWE